MRSNRPLAAFLVLVGFAAATAQQPQGNPLGRAPQPVADPWARTFTGPEMTLQLVRDGAQYRGTLTFRKSDYPCRAEATPTGLQGRFTAGGEDYPFESTLQGDAMVLSSGGERYELRGQPQAKNPLGERPAPQNPLGLGAPDAPPAPAEPAALPPLQGVYQGPTDSFRHPQGIFSGEMPKGWTIAQSTAEAMVINPGLKPTDTLDCLLVVTRGQVEEAERGADIVAVFAKGEPELRQELQQQGITLQPAQQPAHKVALGGRAGAEQVWQGKAEQAAVSVWVGALVDGDNYLVVTAILVQGKEERFLPGVKSVFASLQPKAPERNQAAERALAGVQFAGSADDGAGGSRASTYRFAGDGGVSRQTLTVGSVGGSGEIGDDAERGTFRVVGEVLYLQFPAGQEVARLEQADGRVTGLRIGNALYRRRN